MADEPRPNLTQAIAYLLAGILACVAGAAAVVSLVVESWRLGTVFGAAVAWTLGIPSLIFSIRSLIRFRRSR